MQTEIKNVPYIYVLWDSLRRVSVKQFFDKDGKIISSENFTYSQISGELLNKELYNAARDLLERTVFGPEIHAEEFIKYLYRIDTVEVWENRYTRTYFNEREDPFLFEFYDVDGFQYGNIGFSFEDSILTSQIWVVMPSKRIIRQWKYEYDPDTEVTRIREFDSLNTVVDDVTLYKDGTQAIFWFTQPGDSSYIGEPRISYRLHDNLEWGRILFMPATGSEDPIQSRVLNLYGDKLEPGEINNVKFEFDPSLVDGSAYDISVEGKSARGLIITKQELLHVTYDKTPPGLELGISPYINSPKVSLTSNEPLISGTLIFRPDSLDFPDHEVVRIMLPEKLTETAHPGTVNTIVNVTLTDSVVYNILFSGVDRAGNRGYSNIAENVHYDISPPVLEILNIQSNSAINNSDIFLILSEDVRKLSATYTGSGGDAIHSGTPLPAQFRAGKKQILKLSSDNELADGGVYSLRVTAADSAGNKATPQVFTSILYDITPPTITMIFPYDHAAIRDPSISYSISENLREAVLSWIPDTLAPDTAEPVMVTLTDDEKTAGDKIHYSMTEQAPLIDGVVYDLKLTGYDPAGNPAEEINIQNVVFDITPPQITDFSPAPGSFINSREISYLISEDLKEGKIVWEAVGGNLDPNSPYLSVLVDSELTGGTHDNMFLTEIPNLQDSTFYSVTFSGSDRAGNQADTIRIDSLYYDISPPALAISFPRSEMFLNDSLISFTIGEDIVFGKFVWDPVDTTKKYLRRLEFELPASYRTIGTYDSIIFNGLPDLVEGIGYNLSFVGIDRAGNINPEMIVENIIYDFQPPVLTISDPGSNEAVNYKNLSYNLSEPLKEGFITWEWTGGAIDEGKVHRQILEPGELSEGDYINHLIFNEPFLVNNAVYSIWIVGDDPAGNNSISNRIENVEYDNIVPEIQIAFPTQNSWLNTTVINYENSEDLEKETFQWFDTSGSLMSSIDLDALHRSRGVKDSAQIIQEAEIVEGAPYKIIISGNDRAQNQADTVIINNVRYDFTPPVMAMSWPMKNGAINSFDQTYSLSEALMDMTMKWDWKSGEGAPGESIIQEFTSEQKQPGDHTGSHPRFYPDIIDGGIYDLTFSGADSAGNQSNIVQISNILYDITVPEIEVHSPLEHSYIATPGVDLTFSEDVWTAEISYRNTGGMEDTAGSHLFVLEDIHRFAGRHDEVAREEEFLVEGAVYTVTVNAADRAGNTAETITIPGVVYDATPPELALHYPLDSLAVNNIKANYETSELLESGMLTWTRIAGAEDLNSPHKVNLSGTDLEAGFHELVFDRETVPLQDSAIYILTFTGNDPAGNAGEPALVEPILYDVSPPIMVISDLTDRVYLNTSEFNYSVSEELATGKITWDGTAGDGSPFHFEYPFAGKALEEGHFNSGALFNPELVDGGTYSLRITGHDLAGNLSEPVVIENIIFDITPPEVDITYPIAGSYVNTYRINYGLSEDVRTGQIRVKNNTGETAIDLNESELEKGQHTYEHPDKFSDVREGIPYNLEMTVTDLAGNVSNTELIPRVIYDFTDPELVLVQPVSNSFINSKEVSGTISEPLSKADLIWATNTDTAIYKIPDNVLLDGDYRLADYPASLSQDIEHTVWISGTDLAGNTSRSNLADRVVFDTVPPELVISNPENGSEVNSNNVSYELSEDLDSLVLVWEQIGNGGRSVSTMVESPSRKKGKHDLSASDLNLDNGNWYKISMVGIDRAGNRGSSITVDSVKYDISPPELLVSSPSSNIVTNQIEVLGSVNETINSAILAVENMDNGERDVYELKPEIMDMKGEFILNLGDLNYLPVDSGMLSVTLQVMDPAGNRSELVTLENILLDQRFPKIIISSPGNDAYITGLDIAYKISEDLSEAEIHYVWSGGAGDPSLNIAEELTKPERSPGKHEQSAFQNVKTLFDGAVYDIYLTGTDRAGNSAQSNPVTRVTYDITPPVVTIAIPENGRIYNAMRLTMEVTEGLTACDLSIIPQPGAEEQGLSVDIMKEEWNGLKLENIDLEKYYRFKNGTSYSFEISGRDSAGNLLKTEPVVDVMFDNIPPVFSMSTPVDAEQIREPVVSYNLNEDVVRGWVRFQDESDQDDPGVIYHLKGADLKAGWHQELELPILDSLQDGKRYTVEIGGVDLAGNQGETIRAENVLFDFRPPVLALAYEGEFPHINKEQISYSSSEDLKDGRLIFTRTGGAVDPGSPHEFEMTGDYLQGGKHSDVELPGMKLMDGTVYQVMFEGNDLANNAGNPAVLGNLHFDNSSPVLSEVSPDSGEYRNELVISYSLNESLLNGRITLKSEGQEAGSYRVPSSDLLAGRHEGVILTDKPGTLIDGLYDIEITGEDSAGNRLVPHVITSITLDRSDPVLRTDYPVAGMRFNRTSISYGISENLSQLSITINKYDVGKVGASIAEIEIPGRGLVAGDFQDYVLDGLEELLENGDSYMITLSARDLAGNDSQLELSDITYDTEPPVLNLIKPEGPAISEPLLQFKLNETLAEGSLVWTPYAAGHPLSVEFNTSEKENLNFGPGILEQQKELSDGVMYELRFSGVDLAGNSTDLVLLDSIMFDQTPAVFSDITPQSGKAVNVPDYGFSISEALSAGSVKWVEKTGSEVEPAPQVFNLSGNTLKQGTHGPADLPLPVLENGKTYSLILEGKDLAGNPSGEMMIEDITFDTELPVLEIVKPDTGTFTNKTSFGIKTSEPLEYGRIFLENTGGITDPESPRILEITENRLRPVKPAGQKLGLVNGAVYTIRFEGRDYAGNQGITIEVPNVTYDNSPPILSMEYPVSDQYHNLKKVTYSLSEDLLDGRITWTATGGKKDPGSPYVLQLEGDALKKGSHTDTVDFPFVEGTVYAVDLAGRDLAENPGEKYRIPYVRYDFTAPELVFAQLEYGKYVNHKKITYTVSEDLYDGTIAWIPVSDPQRPLISELNESESRAGEHREIVVSDTPELMDGERYRVELTGRDRAGNPGVPAIIDELVYDITPPEIIITDPEEGSVMITPEITMTVSEPMRIAIIYWNATEGAADSIGHYEIKLTSEELEQMEFINHRFEGQTLLNTGTVYSLSITGLDSAWNEIPLQDVRDISVIRKLGGDWYFKGAIMTVVWSFEPTGGKFGETGRFKQGVEMGTKISNQESGTYRLDYSKKPWVMEWELESGQKRYSLFEFKGPNLLRVVTGTKLPASWEDGEVMIYENR